jgi:hypothetical protein
MAQFGLYASSLFASPIRSSGVQDFSVASLGPRYLPIEATPATKPALPARRARGAVKSDAAGIAYAVERNWLILSGGLHSASLTEKGRQQLKAR